MKSDVETRPSAAGPTHPGPQDPESPLGRAAAAPETEPYRSRRRIRIVTATSLFDGHDAAINVMRRLLQASGAEVIHLGHNHSAREIAECAIQEDAQAVAITSYQGGHMEFFKYVRDLLRERGCGHIRIFGGGGGVILPREMRQLHAYGISRIYSPDDGRAMGLQGMINDLLRTCDAPAGRAVIRGRAKADLRRVLRRDFAALARLITAVEDRPAEAQAILRSLRSAGRGEAPGRQEAPVLGVTGTGGSGKSSLIDELLRRFLRDHPERTVAVVSVDPTKRKTGGALLGDRIRMNAIDTPRVYMRSMASRESNTGLPRCLDAVIGILQAARFGLIVLETPGIGQSDTTIVDHSALSLYVMTPEYGAPTQLEKIGMLDFADLVAVNKSDKRGAEDALRDVTKQYEQSRRPRAGRGQRPRVFGVCASRFRDPGVDRLYRAVLDRIEPGAGEPTGPAAPPAAGRGPLAAAQGPANILPLDRSRYLGEIAQTVKDYNRWADEQAEVARRLFAVRRTMESLGASPGSDSSPGTAPAEHGIGASGNVRAETTGELEGLCRDLESRLELANQKLLDRWDGRAADYRSEEFAYEVRGKQVRVLTGADSLSGIRVPKVALPRYRDRGDLLRWMLRENLPGEFPFAGGVFPFRREREDPTRMFAGEGGPERTNRRFHYLSRGMQAKRLSTAFDAVTLYGSDPDLRPDIFGKIGNSGVSIACLDDAKKLYSGFDLADPRTSVSMTINGPAPAMTAYFMNAAIDQQCELHLLRQGKARQTPDKIAALHRAKGARPPAYQGALPEGHGGLGLLLLGATGADLLPRDVYERIKADTISKVRGTVQADILKEDQAQNTCIYAIDFALKLMGDMQEYFVRNKVGSFYSVSISGYHIAEAGANPVTQLALTLANGFTYVEHYLSRGMKIDEFAPSLSFFFSSGMDPEYSVIGRVARVIWAKAMKLRYGADAQSQRLKYHCQTSGRSLHAQEVEFNDIRTTLQGLCAIHDNCNSLHTNAFDEAITTPTEESVRRALAIQLIINHEFGLAKNQNSLQGSFVIEELTDLVEQAVLAEFERLSARGGVLGAMETAYQRGKIQEESLRYESLKHAGQIPIMGVNTFLSASGSPTVPPKKVTRASEAEKRYQIRMLREFHKANSGRSAAALEDLRRVAAGGGNVFESLMDAGRCCSLGQITGALFETGGQYRRSL